MSQTRDRQFVLRLSQIRGGLFAVAHGEVKAANILTCSPMRDRSILGVYHTLPDKEREQEPELCPPSMDAPRSSSGRDCVRPHMRLWVAHATRRP